ncbi:MAG: hydrolase [Methylotenera sp. RIFCSPLOWO2_02_FULL_45_14]|nr:MAG: hydrolase [Methylotenera sp. RIFCSPLOWO2_02_FULL_45_14]
MDSPYQNLKASVTLSQLVLVDMQVRLASVMPPDAMTEVIKNCGILVQAASMLNVPLMLTEQYPKGLGHTVPALSALLAHIQPVEKTTFSCLAAPKFKRQLTRDHSQIILTGMEAHICILQTALDLVTAGKQVFVVEDAVVSRNPANKVNALARLRDAGCIVTNTESLVFEWLGAAEGDAFKVLAKLIR